VLPPAPVAADSDHVYHLFVVRSTERDALRDHLDASGIASAVHYPTPIHLQPAYAALGLGPGDLPVAERLASENCSLPIFPAIEDWHIAEIVSAVESFEAAAAS
jgi:dTDP-4-amino-4,6-dideoxygalactose transaminase